jgi:hypothetical protein
VISVNASAPVLAGEHEVQSKIRKISAFSRGARIACAALFGFGVVGSVFTLILSLLGRNVVGPSGAGLTPQFVTYGVWLLIVYQLYGLFGSLAAGAIYTSENVRRVRRVGFLWLLWAALGVLTPLVWNAFEPPGFQYAVSMADTLSAFVGAGLLLLVSWIMDVGRYEKDCSEALQRDADLVI